ncbi:MAG TPA: hypothetical protein VFY13_04025 [Luteolibacter sp.]|nr:hypothetical protein [Luteolibacter sp.]
MIPAVMGMGHHACAHGVMPPIPTKAKSSNSQKSWKIYQTSLYEHLADFKSAAVKTSAYGGRLDRKEKATGFFHVRKIGESGPWIFIDPEGHHFYSVGVNSVNLRPEDEAAASKAFGNVEGWAKQTRAYLFQELGFNTLGCWSDPKPFQEAGVSAPYCTQWNFMASYARSRGKTYAKYGHAGFAGDCIPVFDPQFVTFCEEQAQKLAKTKDDPWLLGHFSDNELPLQEKGIIGRYLAMPESDPGRQFAQRWLKDKGMDAAKITAKHDAQFCELVVGKYFGIVDAAMRKHDPNHLFLGARFHGTVLNQESVFRAAGARVDVVSVNYYHRWTPEQARLNQWAGWSGKPIIITEWYAKGADSGCDNSQGAGFTVPTQEDRGKFYQNFTIGLMRNPNVIGWHWFRYTDDAETEKSKTCNKGILTRDFKPWQPLVARMNRLNHQAYGMREYLLTARSGHLLDQPTEHEGN